MIRPQSWVISAPITSRFGNFLNEDLAPRVAASLPTMILVQRARDASFHYQRRPKPLSRLDNSSEVKNMIATQGGDGLLQLYAHKDSDYNRVKFDIALRDAIRTDVSSRLFPICSFI